MHLDDQVLFVHNPRTSGTAIRRSLLLGADPNAQAQWPEALGKHAFSSQLRASLPVEVWNTRFKFATVRNPWDRMVSLYGLFRRAFDRDKYPDAKLPGIDLAKFMKSLTAKSFGMSKGEQRRLAIIARSLDFKDWLKFCDDYGWQACRYLEVRPMTRIPQCRWFDGLDKVFRFEDREEIEDFLRSRGYPPTERENTTEHRPWQSYYDAATHDLVAKTYAEDIRRFGY